MPTIRQATESDVTGMVAIVNAAFRVERSFRPGDRTSREDILQRMQTNIFLVALVDNEINGTVEVRVNGTTGYFGMLAVDPTLQRAGIGRSLCDAAEQYCRGRGCTEMTLSTGKVRSDLIPYYRKLGYDITSIDPAPENGPFSKPIEIVRMAKPLKAF